MNFFEKKKIQNAPNPKGYWGRQTLKMMNKRHDGLTDWGLSFLSVDETDKVLDVGCGGGRTVKKLSKKTTDTVWGIDISSAAIEESFHLNKAAIRRDKVVICKADVADMPFDDATFDIVTAVETVYFWKDPDQSFREIFRIMKSGGQVMILTESRADADHPEKWDELKEAIDMNIPSADSLASALTNAGFVGITAHIRGDGLCVIAEKP